MRPIRLALSNDYHVVLVGLAAVLADYPDQVAVIDVTTSPDVTTKPDVILYDTFGKLGEGDHKLRRIVAENDAKVVVYSWENYSADLAVEHGAAGYIFKGVAPSELVRAVVSMHRGDVTQIVAPSEVDEDHSMPSWPGQSAGLSPREAEMLAFIAQGLSNHDISARAYLSINTVKTYIRTAYRKIDVDSRSQAVLWALRNGLAPDF